MSLPRLVLTGASGFIGRHLLESLKNNYRIHALARRSQVRCGAPFHENIIWHQVDIGFADDLSAVFREIQADGGADIVLHLAAHYDFSGEDHPEYHRTNVEGLRNVLENSKLLRPHRFIFSSSVAASAFPPEGEVLNEDSPPDGDHIYAQTKAIGEAMLAEYSEHFPSTIIRFAALFSDWCEYPPLYMFLRTWLSRAWNRRMLGGRGNSAIPYLHINDAVSFVSRVLVRHPDLADGAVVIASPDGSVTHKALYQVSTVYEKEQAQPPIGTPKPLILPGIVIMGLFGKMMKEAPFEKPWMAKYVDLKMEVDASRSRQLLDWQPRERLGILSRIPFLIENRKYDPVDWTKRNRDAMKLVRIRPNLKIHSLLEKHKDEIAATFIEAIKDKYTSYHSMGDKEHAWSQRLIMRNLRNAIRLRVKADFMSYCRDLADLRLDQGFDGKELVGALYTLNEVCLDVLAKDPDADDMQPYIPTCITMTIRFGIDQVKDRIDESQPDVGYVPPPPQSSETGPGCAS
ncbi:MAG: NAD-dependent epimerase/dehydratase family protein [Candidatus Krumholzibacteria bacterium]|nr:NAD-dependent epimerase/dehydratase family protein [Candidatus Krumholzibacteria bacterium]